MTVAGPKRAWVRPVGIVGVAGLVLVGVFWIPIHARLFASHPSWTSLRESIERVRPDEGFEYAGSKRRSDSCNGGVCEDRVLTRFYITELEPAQACAIAISELRDAEQVADFRRIPDDELDPGEDCYADAAVDGRFITLWAETSTRRDPGRGVPPEVTVLTINAFE